MVGGGSVGSGPGLVQGQGQGQGEFLPPRDDLNSPDLYIPGECPVISLSLVWF